MHSPADMSLWQGRIDQEPEGDARRWHQCVVALPVEAVTPGVAPGVGPGIAPGVALLGVCCDRGVTRNQGRAGARGGPDAIRKALAGQAWHLPSLCYDAGNLLCR